MKLNLPIFLLLLCYYDVAQTKAIKIDPCFFEGFYRFQSLIILGQFLYYGVK